ncbi:tail fiber protein [Bergeriella denitrificans]|uniref:Putative phage tail fiber protein n=1 Tax=Bergeriella denitrificans TaxID=494 RepID=A0A378UGB4_BERDE|nr:tail fiber protein [Bergeriella denitrificans]STZ76347.1 putative phage tail fiber protein [Bergeriella denitrificans]
MHPIDTKDKLFHDGNGTSELGTILPAWWLNQFQAEMLAVLEMAGIKPNKADQKQLAAALKKLLTPIDDSSFKLRGALAADRNLNDLTATAANIGVWHNTANAYATEANNYPVRAAGTLFVLPAVAGGTQVYIPYNNSGIWTRTQTSGSSGWNAWKQLGADKLGNSGNQTLANGILNIQRNAWEKYRLTNSDGSYWRFESAPVSANENGARFNYVFVGADNGEIGRVAFPRVAGGETVAYQSFVNTRIAAEKPFLQTINYHTDKSSAYAKTGFYRGNGAQLNGQALPSMEIHIAHPEHANNAYARGLGFAYGDRFDLFTTAWNKDGSYMGMKAVLTELNGVMLNGNQTIAGNKTFASDITVTGAGSSNLMLGSGGADVYVHNTASRKYLQLKDNGDLAYSDNKIYHQGFKPTWADLGFMPIQQGGGANQNPAHKVYIGWGTTDNHPHLSVQVDGTNLGPLAFRDRYETGTVPVGMVAYFTHNNPPPGWIKCNGAALSRTTYAKLFAAVGTYYGAGNGSTTFNIPDVRGEFLRVYDDGRGVDRGRVMGGFQGQETMNHRHGMGAITAANDDALFVRGDWAGLGDYQLQHLAGEYNRAAFDVWNSSNRPNPQSQNLATHGLMTTSGTQWVGETRPRNLSLPVFIRAY